MVVVGTIKCWIQSGCVSLGIPCKVWCHQILEQSITAQCSLTLAWGWSAQASRNQWLRSAHQPGKQVQRAQSIGAANGLTATESMTESVLISMTHWSGRTKQLKCDVCLFNTWSNQSRLRSQATQSNGRIHWHDVLLQVRCVFKSLEPYQWTVSITK